MNIVEDFKEWTISIKEYYMYDDKILSKKLWKSGVQKHFPEAYNKLCKLYGIEWFKEIMYCILRDIPEIPKCKVCNKPLPLRNYVKGFQKYCTPSCATIGHTNNEVLKEKISKSRRANFILTHPDSFITRHDCISTRGKDKNYYYIPNYCKHGDIRIYNKVAHNIEKRGESSFCQSCNQEIYDSYTPSEDDTNQFLQEFPDFYKSHSLAMNNTWWLMYYPKKLKIIISYFKTHIRQNISKDDLPEVHYVFLHKLQSAPKCAYPCCTKLTKFSSVVTGYRAFCDNHAIGYNSSAQELELRNFLKTLNTEVITNTQCVISKELDFYFPDKNFAIEFNGCWWHSDVFKEKDYHRNKYIECQNKGIQLLSVWEDDWTYRKEIIKDIIKSKLGIYDLRIGARKTALRTLTPQEEREFLCSNHIQNYYCSKWRYGLFYNDELILLMSFGPSRFKPGEIELIRYCSKLGVQVIGGASKLFNHFLKEHAGVDIVSYADCNISNGTLYKVLGMKLLSTSENWWWVYKNMRYNRFNKIKNLTSDKAVKAHGTGIMKFIYLSQIEIT